MATTSDATVLKRWAIGEDWTIEKVRDDEGDVSYDVLYRGEFDNGAETLADAREHIRDYENNRLRDQLDDLLSDLDLTTIEATRTLKALIRRVKK